LTIDKLDGGAGCIVFSTRSVRKYRFWSDTCGDPAVLNGLFS